MQPFPHRIFTAADMSSTLADLGLSPSGSLVVKKKDRDQAATGTGESHISKSVLPPSDHLTPSLISVFAVCTMLLRIYDKL